MLRKRTNGLNAPIVNKHLEVKSSPKCRDAGWGQGC
jgi:hypothetical protein